jgi:hypothetical protein
MSSFLERMLKAGEENSAKPVTTTIAKMMISFGYSGYVKGHRTDAVFQPFSDPNDGEKVAAEVSDFISTNGGRSKAVFGMLISVPKDTVLSFNSEWDKSRFIDRFSEEEDFDMVIETMNDLSINPGKWTWCEYETPESLSAVAKGDKGKYEKKKDGVGTGEMVFPRIMVPTEKFPNEMAAQAAVGQKSGAVASTDSQWSDKLRANHDPVTFEKNVEEIQQTYKLIKRTNAKPWEGAPELPRFDDDEKEGAKIPSPLIKQYLAHENLYNCESADIDIALSMTPF